MKYGTTKTTLAVLAAFAGAVPSAKANTLEENLCLGLAMSEAPGPSRITDPNSLKELGNQFVSAARALDFNNPASVLQFGQRFVRELNANADKTAPHDSKEMVVVTICAKDLKGLGGEGISFTPRKIGHAVRGANGTLEFVP